MISFSNSILNPFLIYPLLAGGALCFVTAPLGCLMMWRRLSFFADTLAHGALLGVVLGLLCEQGPRGGIFMVAGAIAFGLSLIPRRTTLAMDTWLTVISHGALGTGLLALSLMRDRPLNWGAYLFGDLLAVSSADLSWILGGGLVVLLVLGRLWNHFLSITVDEDLAAVEGEMVFWLRLTLMGLVALVITVALKMIGALLLVALFIIPAAAARPFAKTPEQMVFIAMLIGILSVASGLLMSLYLDTPPSPGIVVVGLGFVVVVSLLNKLRKSS